MKRILVVLSSFVILAGASCISNSIPTPKPTDVKSRTTNTTNDTESNPKVANKTADSTKKTDANIAFEVNLKNVSGSIDVIALSENRYFLISFHTGKGFELENLVLLDDKGKQLFNFTRDTGNKPLSINSSFFRNNDKLYLTRIPFEGESDRKSYLKAIDLINGTFEDVSMESLPPDARYLNWNRSNQNMENDNEISSEELALKTGVNPHETEYLGEVGSESRTSKLKLQRHRDFNLCLRINTINANDAPSVSMDYLGVFKGDTFQKLWTFEKEFGNSDVYADKLVIIDDYNVTFYNIATGEVIAKYENSRYCKIANDLCFVGTPTENGTLIKAINLRKIISSMQ